MGRNFLFECPRCGHRARVAGGISEGIWFVVQTVRCRDCKELHDAVIEMKCPLPPLAEMKIRPGLKSGLTLRRLAGLKRAPDFQTAVNRLPPEGSDNLHWIKFRPFCPVSPRHRVEPWLNPGRCPKCEWNMDSSPLPFRRWE